MNVDLKIRRLEDLEIRSQLRVKKDWVAGHWSLLGRLEVFYSLSPVDKIFILQHHYRSCCQMPLCGIKIKV